MCWHNYSLWSTIQDNKCEGRVLQERICKKCQFLQRKTLYYTPTHTWTKWVETGTLKRHYYGPNKDQTLIMNKVLTRICSTCNRNEQTFT